MKKFKYIFPLMISIPLISFPTLVVASCSYQDFENTLNRWLDKFNQQINDIGYLISPDGLNNLKNAFLTGKMDNKQQSTILNLLGAVVGIPNWVVEGVSGKSINDWVNLIADKINSINKDNFEEIKQEIEDLTK